MIKRKETSATGAKNVKTFNIFKTVKPLGKAPGGARKTNNELLMIISYKDESAGDDDGATPLVNSREYLDER